MDGISNEVFIGAASLAILLVSTLYFALQQRPHAPQRPAPQPQPAPPQPAPPGANAGQAAAERIRAAEAPPPAADDDADAIALNLRIGEGRPVRHRVARHSTIGELRHQLFANEIASGLLVRLIYNGQLLDDAQSFTRLGVLNESYIICHIAVPDGEAHAAGGNPPREQVLDRFGGWLHVWVICGFLLVTLWGLCFTVPELFTNMTVVMLDMLTVGLTAWVVLTMRANQIAPQADAPQPQAPQQ